MGNSSKKTVTSATNIKIMVLFHVELTFILIIMMSKDSFHNNLRDLGLILNHGTSISSQQKQITPVLCYLCWTYRNLNNIQCKHTTFTDFSDVFILPRIKKKSIRSNWWFRVLVWVSHIWICDSILTAVCEFNAAQVTCIVILFGDQRTDLNC